jgi:hypothetical protein
MKTSTSIHLPSRKRVKIRVSLEGPNRTYLYAFHAFTPFAKTPFKRWIRFKLLARENASEPNPRAIQWSEDQIIQSEKTKTRGDSDMLL